MVAPHPDDETLGAGGYPARARPGWPPAWDADHPRSGATEEPLDLPRDLPQRGIARTALELSRREVITKGAALRRYATQQEVIPALLGAFVRRTEPFTVFTGAAVRGGWES